MKHGLLNKVSAISKVAYVSHCPGHKNSKGELAEWCVKSHEDGHIISSHGSQEAAKKHLQDMHAHSGSKSTRAPLPAEQYLILVTAGLDPKLAASLKGWPTKLVLALAMLLTTGGDLKAQVAQELQSRGQAVPAQLQNSQAPAQADAPVESVGEMTIEPAPPKPTSEEIVPPTKPGYNDNTQFLSPEPNAKPEGKGEDATPGKSSPAIEHPENTRRPDPNKLNRAGLKKRAFGYYNFEWQGNDALLLGPDKQTMLLSGKAARDFQNELERVEDEIPHDKALELAVNDLVKKYFETQN